jgi:hypothetical protein
MTNLTFEKALAELEAIVAKLEKGGLRAEDFAAAEAGAEEGEDDGGEA